MKVPLGDLPAFVRDVLARISAHKDRATILALRGALGAGKTTFVQALGKELNIQDTMQSPTYVLMKSYPIAWRGLTKLVHIDAYRLEDPKEFRALRPEEFLNDPQALICVEWPERLAGALPKPDLELTFSADGAQAGERYIEVV